MIMETGAKAASRVVRVVPAARGLGRVVDPILERWNVTVNRTCHLVPNWDSRTVQVLNNLCWLVEEHVHTPLEIRTF